MDLKTEFEDLKLRNADLEQKLSLAESELKFLQKYTGKMRHKVRINYDLSDVVRMLLETPSCWEKM